MNEVLLVGNPNSGKTTLFNSLTRSNEHVGNWHGVTVDTKSKSFSYAGEQYNLIDTPGIYSLCPLSFEEEVAVDTIFKSERKIINICDQNNLQRNLYLTLCLIEKGCDVVLAINEIDKKPIYKIDYKKLENLLGIPVVNINAEKKIGMGNLKKALKTAKKPKKMPYFDDLDVNLLAKNNLQKDFYNLIKLYEQDEKYFKRIGINETENLFKGVPKDSPEVLAKLRFDFIESVLQKCTKKIDRVYGQSKLDKFVLNKWLCFPIFLCVMAGIFYLTFFSLGAFLSSVLEGVLGIFTNSILGAVEGVLGKSWLYELLNTAVFGGVGTVLSFLPQVVLLFFFLSVLEDSGYLARIAFIFEDILGKIGLSGKSVYTLLMGFGCSTTAIMTARNMDDKNAKIKTAILCPYMSCSAKIPIYTVVGGAFFGASNIFVIMGLYFLGVVVALAISKVLDVTVLKSKNQSFILEFPPYRMTSPKRVGKLLWKNVKEFLIRVGSVMVAMNIIIWVLSSFSFSFAYVQLGQGSMLETIGRVITPIFAPLGFANWAIVASLIAGLVAKEVVVSSIAMFNGIDAGANKLISNSILLSTSLVFFKSKASVLAFLVFCLLYTPCVASISMLLQEIGKKWTLISIGLQLVTAYVVALMVYNVAFAFEIFGVVKCLSVLLVCASFVLAVVFIARKIRNKKICGNCQNCNNQRCNKK